MVKLQKSAQRLELAAPAYRLTFDRERPWMVGLATGTGCPIADLFVGCGVDSVQGRDELGPVQPPRLSREGEATVVTFEGGSSLWDAKRYVLTCRDGEVDLRVEVDGRGRLDRCHFGQGCLPEDLAGLGLGPNRFRDYERPLSDLARGSRPHFQAYYTARPTAAEHDLRLRWEDESIDLTDDPGRHGGCDSFLPAPWAFALELPGDEPWVGIGLAPQPDQLEFGAVRYRGGTTFGFSLDYDGRVSVDGTWVSPALIFSFGARDALGAFRALLASLRERGLVSAPEGPSPGWWSRPAFDGTGQQHWLAETGDPRAECRQPVYERALERLARAGLQPGATWLGEGWMGPTLGQPDLERWPDLPGFIAAEHEAGRRVVLTWPLFDDHRDEEAPIAHAVTTALSPQGLNADGLKLVQVTPRGDCVGRLQRRLALVREAARRARPDALLVAPTINPYFAHLVDMVHLGSLWTDRLTVAPLLRHRALLARLASPSWLLAVGDWHAPSRAAWHEAVVLADELGVPVLSHVDGLPSCGEPLTAEDHAAVAGLWASRR